MNFNSLVWYSSLAIGDEKNSYVANFLKRSCEIINEEINKEIKEKNLPFTFNIDFSHVVKGEEGVQSLLEKFKSINDIVFTNGHSINKYNPSIINELKKRKFFFFPQNLTISKLDDFEADTKKRIFKLSRADQKAKIAFINNEISKYTSKKVYFFHQGLRLSESLLKDHKDQSYFTSFSFKDFDLEKLEQKFQELLIDLKNDELIVLDLNLSVFRTLFEHLIKKGYLNKVITTFGSLQNRFEKLPFDLIQLVGNHDIPSVAIEDLMSKVYGENITPDQKILLLDSTFRLEVPLLAFECLKKIFSNEDQQNPIHKDQLEDKIVDTFRSFNGHSDIFVGKRIQYAFDDNNSNTTRENYAFTFPNSLQTENFKIPKVFYPKQFCTVNDQLVEFDTVYTATSMF